MELINYFKCRKERKKNLSKYIIFSERTIRNNRIEAKLFYSFHINTIANENIVANKMSIREGSGIFFSTFRIVRG